MSGTTSAVFIIKSASRLLLPALPPDEAAQPHSGVRPQTQKLTCGQWHDLIPQISTLSWCMLAIVK